MTTTQKEEYAPVLKSDRQTQRRVDVDSHQHTEEEPMVVFNVADLEPGSELAVLVSEMKKRPRIIDDSYCVSMNINKKL